MSLQAAYDAYAAGRLAEAERLCARLMREQPARTDARSLHAVVLARLGRYAEAEAQLRELAAREPNEMLHAVNLGCVFLDQNRVDGAVEWFREARALAPLDPGVNFNLGITLYRMGDLPEACDYLALALRLQPGLHDAAVYLARARLELGQRGPAREALERITTLDPLSASTLNELGLAWAGLDEFTRAEDLLQRALLVDPKLHEARINLATLTEKRNQAELTQSILEQVPEDLRGDPNFALVQARLLARSGRNEEALQSLDRFATPAGLPASLLSDVQFERGKLLDRLGRYDQAYAALLEANSLVRDNFRRFQQDIGDENAPIPWLERGLDTVEPYTSLRPVGEAEGAPVFIVGFPRSGTTLLDQILDSHPRLQVLEEKPALDAVISELHHHPRGFPESLNALTDADWAAARRVYWQSVGKYLTRRPGTTLVDKYPLHMVRVPLIRRLFPASKIVLALRHPCDAVLSCFMQNFRFTEATHGFWSLEGSARIYDQLMRQWEAQRAKYQPDVFEIRYEQLVEEFRVEVGRLIEFLGVGWDDAVLNYQQHALKRGAINTPSYNQVVKPIYKTAVGRWRHYRRYFDSSLPLLAAHIERLGYTA